MFLVLCFWGSRNAHLCSSCMDHFTKDELYFSKLRMLEEVHTVSTEWCESTLILEFFFYSGFILTNTHIFAELVHYCKCVKMDEVVLVFCAVSLQGADLNSTDCKGNTPLLLATSCGAWKTVALLLSRGETQSCAISTRRTQVICEQIVSKCLCLFKEPMLMWKTNVDVTSFTWPFCNPKDWKTSQKKCFRYAQQVFISEQMWRNV